MTQKDITIYLVLILFAAAGIYIGRFLGGTICGAAFMMLMVILIGRRLANKAAERIDKRVRDLLMEDEG